MSQASFCLVADASCDLPMHLSSHAQLRLLPVRVVVGDQHLIDRREGAAIEKFYAQHLSSKSAVSGRSEPLSVDEMLQAFSNELALNFDEALGVFVSASRSLIFKRAREAVSRARISSYHQRLNAGRTKPLQVDCVDSKSLFAGYAAQVTDLLDHMDAGAGISEIIKRQAQTLPRTYAYMAPGDVSYILERAALKGEKSVSALAGFAAKSLSIVPIIQAYQGDTKPVSRRIGRANAHKALLDMARKMISQQMLISQNICLSYSGDPKQITNQAAFMELVNVALQAGVRVHLAPMSITGSVNVGPNALVVGFLAKDHDVSQLL
jgi:fatty acid-binding protein DegV